MARHPLPTTGHSTPASSEGAGDTARATAVAALVHRMNGALNNASMALELVLGGAARADEKTSQVLRTGLTAVAQASRAAALLAHLVHGRGVPPGDDVSYRRDVEEIVRERGGGAQSASTEVDGGPASSAAEAAEWLVAELARMQSRSSQR